MSINEIIVQMKLDVSVLSFGELATGGLVTTFLAMAIVFSVLIMLMFMIKIMTKIMVKTEAPAKVEEIAASVINEETEINIDNSEEIAAIMAAISAMSGVSENRLVIRDIKIVENNWSLQGRMSQIGNRI